jgi:hypothetical protein
MSLYVHEKAVLIYDIVVTIGWQSGIVFTKRDKIMTKTALITGITGMDGSYLAELLLDKGYEIYVVIRRLSTPDITRIEYRDADRSTG